MRIALQHKTNESDGKTKQYYSFLASTLAVAREENWPALLGYVILFFTMATVYLLHQLHFIEVDIQREMKAYIAGAATVHLGISSIKFNRSMRYREERGLQDRDTIDLIIFGHDVSAATMQSVVTVADQFVEVIPRRLAILGGIASLCLLITLVL